MFAHLTITAPVDLTPNDAFLRLIETTPPVVLDLRIAEDRAALPQTLPGAATVAHADIEKQLQLCGERAALLFCHRGLKLTHGAAARLATRCVMTFRLRGGIVAWQEENLPLVDSTDDPMRLVIPTQSTLHTLPQIWAVLRFSAPRAEILEVAPEHVADVARTFDAEDASTLTVPALPNWVALLELVKSPAFSTQFHGLECNPRRALPLLDALYRGVLS